MKNGNTILKLIIFSLLYADDLHFKVYNRYGKLMFETTNPDAGWNGYFNGAPQPMGIYIWIAVGIANDGSSVQKKGETLLLR